MLNAVVVLAVVVMLVMGLGEAITSAMDMAPELQAAPVVMEGQ